MIQIVDYSDMFDKTHFKTPQKFKMVRLGKLRFLIFNYIGQDDINIVFDVKLKSEDKPALYESFNPLPYIGLSNYSDNTIGGYVNTGSNGEKLLFAVRVANINASLYITYIYISN